MRLVELKKKKDRKNAVYSIALVESPAIEVGFVYLSNNNEVLIKLNEEKNMIYTPILIPNKKILRMDSNQEPYEIFFSAETIEEASRDYQKAKINDEWNDEHTAKQLGDVNLVESWIIGDSDNDKSISLGFEGLPVGTWMGGIEVKNKEALAKIKNGEYKGVSIEGYFEEDNKLNQIEMNKIEKALSEIKTLLTSEVKTKLGSIEREGMTLYFEGEEFTEDKTLYVDEEMTKIYVKEETEEMKSEANPAIEKLEELAEGQLEVIKQQSEKIESQDTVIAELKTELASIKVLVNEHNTKLAKVESEASESVTKLSSQDNAKPSAFQSLKARMNK